MSRSFLINFAEQLQNYLKLLGASVLGMLAIMGGTRLYKKAVACASGEQSKGLLPGGGPG